MLTLIAALVVAQPRPIKAMSEGAQLGAGWVHSINCSGSGITCTRDAGTGVMSLVVSPEAVSHVRAMGNENTTGANPDGGVFDPTGNPLGGYVPFNQEWRLNYGGVSWDTLGEYSVDSGIFTAQNSGFYHVTTGTTIAVESYDSMIQQFRISIHGGVLWSTFDDGGFPGNEWQGSWTASDGGAEQVVSCSTENPLVSTASPYDYEGTCSAASTLYLSAGDQIFVTAYQSNDDGDPRTISPDAGNHYFTIDRLPGVGSTGPAGATGATGPAGSGYAESVAASLSCF